MTTTDQTIPTAPDPHELEAFAVRLATMSRDEVLAYLRVVQDDIARRNEDNLAALVLAVLERDGLAEGAVSVAWPTWDWDNGHFYQESAGRVKYADGTTVEHVDFSDTEVEKRLAELSGDGQPLGETSGLRLDLKTGEVEHDTYMFAHED